MSAAELIDAEIDCLEGQPNEALVQAKDSGRRLKEMYERCIALAPGWMWRSAIAHSSQGGFRAVSEATCRLARSMKSAGRHSSTRTIKTWSRR